MEIVCKKEGNVNEITIAGVNELRNLDAVDFENWLACDFYGNVAKKGEETHLILENIDYADSRAYIMFLRLSRMNMEMGCGKPYLKGVHGQVERLFDLNPGDYRKFEFV